MAQKTYVQVIDDLDQQEIDGDGKTVRFGLDQAQYEIDLSEANAERLHDALAPFIAAGRRVGGRSNGGAAKTETSELQAIRQWARDHGMTVAERGRVSKEVQEAYRAAT